MKLDLFIFGEMYSSIFEQIEDISACDPEDIEGVEDPEAYKQEMINGLYEAITNIDSEFADKVENLACFVKKLEYEADLIAKEERRLQSRKKQKQKLAAYLKQQIMIAMESLGKSKVHGVRFNISLRNNPESVVIDDEQGFITWAEEHDESLLKYKMPEVDKTKVKAVLKAGGDLPEVHLERTKSLLIK